MEGIPPHHFSPHNQSYVGYDHIIAAYRVSAE